MDICRIVIGYAVSTIIGALVLWLFIDKWLWPLISRKHGIEEKQQSSPPFREIKQG